MHIRLLLNKTPPVSIGSLLNKPEDSSHSEASIHGLVSPPSSPTWQSQLQGFSQLALSDTGLTSPTTSSVRPYHVIKPVKKERKASIHRLVYPPSSPTWNSQLQGFTSLMVSDTKSTVSTTSSVQPTCVIKPVKTERKVSIHGLVCPPSSPTWNPQPQGFTSLMVSDIKSTVSTTSSVQPTCVIHPVKTERKPSIQRPVSPPSSPTWHSQLHGFSLLTLSDTKAALSTPSSVRPTRVTKAVKKERKRPLRKHSKYKPSKYLTPPPEDAVELKLQLASFVEKHHGLPRKDIVRAFVDILDSFGARRTGQRVGQSGEDEKWHGRSNRPYTDEQVDAMIYLLRDLHIRHKHAPVLFQALWPKMKASSPSSLNSRLYRADYFFPRFEDDVPVTENGRQVWYRVKAKEAKDRFKDSKIEGNTLLLKHPERVEMYDFILPEDKDMCEQWIMMNPRLRKRCELRSSLEEERILRETVVQQNAYRQQWLE
ncbi:hypothetical protein BP6252_12616 [Coleophoma cylindrospora]|uniref:Uncharacterized protein n=1 Tax=Coleophoma cylindrospora TaxID=1849047 RepID=A0A3D8QCL3_9HELO|nr:hypothetical protein BP6252_12616 [Coleophoma cylindrospora]